MIKRLINKIFCSLFTIPHKLAKKKEWTINQLYLDWDLVMTFETAIGISAEFESADSIFQSIVRVINYKENKLKMTIAKNDRL
jgi:hypothetical protein